MKRSPLQRKQSLSADPAKTRDWQQRSRRRLPPKSTHRQRQEATEDRPAVRAAVFERDGHCRLKDLDSEHRCFGPMTAHHLRKEGQGGGYTEENLVALCAFGNDWVEDNPNKAKALGLVVSAYDPKE